MGSCILDPGCLQPWPWAHWGCGGGGAGGRSGQMGAGEPQAQEVLRGTRSVCLCACACTSVHGDAGTLEPCLAKTSHSPLVSAISSLTGHLNSSGNKERKRGEGAPGSCDGDTKHRDPPAPQQTCTVQTGPRQLGKCQSTASASQASLAPQFSSHP